jgi:hypothetical protein
MDGEMLSLGAYLELRPTRCPVAGAFATSLIFFVLLIAEIMLGLFVITYACHNFLTVMQDTAAGNDDVNWPDEPLQDWLPRGAYLVGLIAVILAPVGFLRVMLKSNGVTGDLTLPLLATGAVLFWLAFPVCLLSSLSGSSRLFMLRAKVLMQLLRIPGAVLIFYIVSAVLFAAFLGLAYLTLLNEWFLLVPVTAVAATVVLMTYARLLGRVAWLLDEVQPVRRRPRERMEPMPAVRSEVLDPWAAPQKKRKRKKRKAKKAPPINVPVEGYSLSDEPPAAPPSEVPLDGSPPIGEEPFVVQHPRDVPPTEGNEQPRQFTESLEYELAIRSKLPSPPEHPLFSGVYSFPWYASSRRALAFLSIGFFLMGLLAVALMLIGLPGS